MPLLLSLFVSGQFLKLIESFLADRIQRTVLNGKISKWDNISAGVPQGSILGPPFSFVYINDLTTHLKCNVKLFANDTTIFSVAQNPYESTADLNHHLDLIKCWAHDWRISFNPDPAKQAVEVIFSKKKIPVDHPPIFFNDIAVMNIDEHKHLGVVLVSRMTFSSHIQSAINKARRGIGVLRLLSIAQIRLMLSKLYVCPHLDNGDIIYHILQKLNDFSHEITLKSQME